MSRSARVFSGAGRVSRTPIKRLTFTQVRQLGITLFGVLAVLWVCEQADFIDQGDSHLRYLYYQIQSPDTATDRVVLVAMDEDTGTAWGPPPWSWRHYNLLLATILAAEPVVVGVLEPGPRVLPHDEPDFEPAVAEALAADQIILPPVNPGLAQPRLDVYPYHGIEVVSLGSGTPQGAEIRAAAAAAAAAEPEPEPEFEPAAEPEVEFEPAAEPEVEFEPAAAAEVESGAAADPAIEFEPAAAAEVESGAAADPAIEFEPGFEPAAEAGAEPAFAVESEFAAGPEASITGRVIRAAGLPMPDDDQLWVHYLGGRDSLPTVSAHRVVTGEIPGSVFRDRIVIIGLRGERFAPLVPTPLGPLSPAEVHAYAIRGLAHDAVWQAMPWWARWLLWAVLALLCLLILPRFGVRGVVIVLIAVVGAIVAVDYTVFTLGILRLGATGALLAVAAAAGASWLDERRRAYRELNDLSRWTAKRFTLDASGQPGRASSNEFWNRFSRAGRAYIQFESTLLGELPEGGWHLRFEMALGVSPDQINELRRDIRREPYKSAYMSHRPIWVDRFMDSELAQKTLLIPLTTFNRILGLWVVNFRADLEVESSRLRLVEMLAEQISLTMERRRIRRLLGGSAPTRDSLLLQPIRETRSTVQFFAHEQNNLAQLFESLPVGVLVATLWGEIEYINASMRRFLASVNLDNVHQRGLPDLLAILTDASEADVQDTVLQLVSGRPFVRLSCNPHAGIDPSYHVVLSSLSQTPLIADNDDAGSEHGALSHFVLTVTRRASGGRQSMPQSALSGG